MRRVSLLLATFMVTLASNPSVADLSDISVWNVPSKDPVAAVGHGAILDAEGRTIDPSPAFVIEAQRFYLK